MNIPNLSWMQSRPIADFYKTQNERQDYAQNQMRTQREQEALPFNIPMLQQKLLEQQLGNQETQATLPFKGPQAQEMLRSKQMQNQMTQESLPYNLPTLEAALRRAQLGNQQTQQDINMAPQEMAMKKALFEFQKQKFEKENNPDAFNPLMDTSGNAQQVAVAEWYRAQGRPDLADKILAGLGGSNQGIALWKSMPPSNRRDLVAGARGLGYDELEAGQLFAQGKNLGDLAEMKGIPKEHMAEYERIYGPSPQAVNAAQQRQAAEVELDYLGNRFTEMMEPYVDPGAIGGYSATQIVDAVKGANPQQQADFLAATVLYKDLAMLRNRLGMGENGITAVQEMEKASLGNIKPFTKLVTPEVFTLMNNRVNTELKEASRLANKAIFNPEVLAEERRKHQIEKKEKEKGSSDGDLSKLSTEDLMKMAEEEGL